ncbi:hypothetical protein QUA43_13000, partial [Microcoleus sp. N9_B4]
DGDDSVYGGEGNNVLKGGNGQDSLIGGSSSDIFVLSPSSGLDNIFYFQGDRDYFGLSQDLTFDQLQIVQGGENYTNDALISIAGTGEHLAWVKDTQFSAIDSSRFISITPGAPLPGVFNTPSDIDLLTGEPVDSNDVLSAIDSGFSTNLSSAMPAPISQPNSTTTALMSQQNSTNSAPETITLQPLPTATNPDNLTVISANTIPDDILLNGGAIPTMMTFSETDDDILIYDTNSLLGSLTSAQTQPIIPLNGTTVNSAIYPIANTSANDNSLLITPAASPSNPLANSDLTGISTL